ncbi:MAG: Rrf2 family transcriptional regulator [Clostridia bacterium]|nr:Rrf2 family transcriptional regulator [Clostridia bacterium]NCC43606.1 Rrf2 family transcriptional regulator [Clostridia bacterium]
MKLSTKGRYGLRAMIDLAVYSEKAPVSIQSIADRQSISERYLEQLMASLKKAGLVSSIRGANGGYQLARPAIGISVGDVLRALEGDLRAVICSGQDGEGSCENADACVTRYVWQRINESITHAVDTMYLNQLVDESRKLKDKGQTQSTGCKG